MAPEFVLPGESGAPRVIQYLQYSVFLRNEHFRGRSQLASPGGFTGSSTRRDARFPVIRTRGIANGGSRSLNAGAILLSVADSGPTRQAAVADTFLWCRRCKLDVALFPCGGRRPLANSGLQRVQKELVYM